MSNYPSKTVAQLRAVLSTHPDDMPVVIQGDGEGATPFYYQPAPRVVTLYRAGEPWRQGLSLYRTQQAARVSPEKAELSMMAAAFRPEGIAFTMRQDFGLLEGIERSAVAREARQIHSHHVAPLVAEVKRLRAEMAKLRAALEAPEVTMTICGEPPTTPEGHAALENLRDAAGRALEGMGA